MEYSSNLNTLILNKIELILFKISIIYIIMSIMDDDKINNTVMDNEDMDDVSIASGASGASGASDVDNDDDIMSDSSSFVQEDIQEVDGDGVENDDIVSIGSYDELYDDLSQNIVNVDGTQGDDDLIDNEKDYVGSDESSDDDFEDDDESINDMTYKKLDSIEIEDYTKLYHNDIYEHNSSEVQTLAIVTRDEFNNIIDDLHQTIPILTKYERARILGQRAKQINAGAPSLVTTPKDTMDGYLIAIQELEAKRIPFIIRRPLPFGGCEYWKVSDLELI